MRLARAEGPARTLPESTSSRVPSSGLGRDVSHPEGCRHRRECLQPGEARGCTTLDDLGMPDSRQPAAELWSGPTPRPGWITRREESRSGRAEDGPSPAKVRLYISAGRIPFERVKGTT